LLRLHQIFLVNLIALLFVVLTAILGVSYYYIKTIDVESLKEYLPKNLALIETLIESQKTTEQIDKVVQKVRADTGIRVTMVDENGTVLIETDKAVKEMVNHATRPEIMQAMREGKGVSVRFSTTTNKNYIYYVKTIELNGQKQFLRIAYPTSIIEDYLYSIWFKITIVFMLAVIVGTIFSYKINKKIQSQITQVTDYLTAIEAKDFKAEIKPAFAAEFFSIARMLKILALKLEKKERQKRKYTAKLKLKNRQTTEIIEAISHEFKNPVSAIMGYTETLINDPDIDRKISEKFLEKVYKNSQTISSMIDRLSLSLKLENNSLSPSFEEFSIKEALEDAKSQLAHKYSKREIEIVGENYQVTADKTMIKLVMVNLMENALKYSEENVIVTISSENSNVKIEVKDFGLGIPERELANITQKFYRLSKNSWDNSLGLGLALVSYILKLHSSELSVESKVAMGSTFGFRVAKAK
jgi:two-component system, OmpR family, phosphate regulon sensor histidine kinase PhoR